MICLITYELKNKEYEHDKLHDNITNLGQWWHYIENTWIVRTERDVKYCTDLLHSCMDNEDKLFIVDITAAEFNGWLPEKAWRWIENQKHL